MPTAKDESRRRTTALERRDFADVSASQPRVAPATPWRRSRGARFLALALVLKGLHVGLSAAFAGAPWVEFLGAVASVALLIGLGWLLVWLFAYTRRRLLWRVRRKLILSYVFIGVVPALLIIAFFLFAGVLMFFHVSAYLFKKGIDDIVDEAVVMAETTASELRRTPGVAVKDVLDRKRLNGRQRYPNVSLALVPRGGTRRGLASAAQSVGPWEHVTPPDRVPEWVGVGGFAGLVAYPAPVDPDAAALVIRAVAVADQRDPAWAVIVDLPVDDHVLASVREMTGISLNGVQVIESDGNGTRIRGGAPLVNVGAAGRWSVNSMTFFDYTAWDTGTRGTLLLTIRVSVRELYGRITDAQSRRGNFSFGDVFMIALGILAVLFFIIEIVALVMGWALARSITGSIHQLFQGTRRVRMGDFTHRIEISNRDQLGELADSFNDMTSSIQDLLRQQEEKRRLEEELRIAREIQMSLLPRGPLRLGGLGITALCVPAREVGGDYYDFFPLGDDRVGLLIADVAGKGTSAALYMAELKGLMLSLSQIHQSPKVLLVEVNRILSEHLDSRSFITMTYAVLDLRARTLTYARAGHTPLIHLPGGGDGQACLLAPNGLVVGLRIEGMARKFEQLLVESVIPLTAGDVFVLFTDGITEAMNIDADLFGEPRLMALVQEHGGQTTEILRERILRDIDAFVGDADQHDDMTMILVKVEGAGRLGIGGTPPAEAMVSGMDGR